ncbi:hypothetical protein SAMN06265371_102410 [Lutibacter agarilyticus]|uniref:Uncharacterized protein n=1 Tax=Lutibacter agarilyticus TaxID=1109740 RepID=A0A238W4R4_9FLAO|nr:hypothetical protein [Lutibacter agarilyticus]SNR41314.1 hypothetical protein SAMN06265371_102410 [Lutibacter agarilyticus]
MKTRFIHIIINVFLFLLNNNLIAQRDGGSRGVTDPGTDPDAVPIDDYLWVLIVIALVFAVKKLNFFARDSNPSELKL